jgi:glycosyltransferase involved in cell wall biosynthesis
VTDIVFAIPGDIDLPTGGYAYDRRVLGLLPSFGLKVKHLSLPGTFPTPSSADLKVAAQLLAKTDPGVPILFDGLAYGTLPVEMIRGMKRRIIALVHHPLSLETGLIAARQAALLQSERAALGLAEKVVCTSPSIARILAADFGVPEKKIVVAEPGTDPAPKASGTVMPMQLLAVGAVSQRKGYRILVEALERLPPLDWRLTIAGSLERDLAAVADLKTAISSSGLQDRIRLTGAVVPDTLAAFYDAADIFVMPSLFEGYGMVLAEAMAHGLPILCTTGGAAAETVPDAAAIKVSPGDAVAFSVGLKTLISDRKVRRRLEAASWAAGRKLPTWHETARRIYIAVTGLGVATLANEGALPSSTAKSKSIRSESPAGTEPKGTAKGPKARGPKA